jgi:hypothetical protein
LDLKDFIDFYTVVIFFLILMILSVSKYKNTQNMTIFAEQSKAYACIFIFPQFFKVYLYVNKHIAHEIAIKNVQNNPLNKY